MSSDSMVTYTVNMSGIKYVSTDKTFYVRQSDEEEWKKVDFFDSCLYSKEKESFLRSFLHAFAPHPFRLRVSKEQGNQETNMEQFEFDFTDRKAVKRSDKWGDSYDSLISDEDWESTTWRATKYLFHVCSSFTLPRKNN